MHFLFQNYSSMVYIYGWYYLAVFSVDIHEGYLFIIILYSHMTDFEYGSSDIKVDSHDWRTRISLAMDVIPAAESKVIEAKKDKLLGAVDLKTLINDLGWVGAFIHIAYNAWCWSCRVKIHGFIDYHEVQDLGYDITKFYDQSAF